MSGIKDVVDDMKFEAWLRTCAAMSPLEKRKRLSQIDSTHRKRSAAAEERDREFSRDDERASHINGCRCRDDDEPVMPDCGSGLPSTRYFGRRGMTDHE